MTRHYGTAAAAAIVAFGIGVMVSDRANSVQTDPELAVLQQIEQNTAATNAQLTTLNQQIAKLVTATSSLARPAASPPGSSNMAPNPPPARN